MTKEWCSYHETKHSIRKIHKIQRTTMSDREFKKGEGAMNIKDYLDSDPLEIPRKLKPTRGQITDACLSYRHDYGLMDRAEREKLRAAAARWREIWDDVLGESDEN